MRDDAVQAVVGARRRDDDHLALGLREPAFLQHQRVVVREERAELVGTMRERQEDVRDETRLLLHFDESRADVLGQFVERRNRIAGDRLRVMRRHAAPRAAHSIAPLRGGSDRGEASSRYAEPAVGRYSFGGT